MLTIERNVYPITAITITIIFQFLHYLPLLKCIARDRIGWLEFMGKSRKFLCFILTYIFLKKNLKNSAKNSNPGKLIKIYFSSIFLPYSHPTQVSRSSCSIDQSQLYADGRNLVERWEKLLLLKSHFRSCFELSQRNVIIKPLAHVKFVRSLFYIVRNSFYQIDEKLRDSFRSLFFVLLLLNI